jgi:hypothetical protein
VYPTVVRSKLKYGNGAPLVWDRLVTIKQFRKTLGPVLRKYFDPEVDLVEVSQHIQPNAFEPEEKITYKGNIDIEKGQRAKSDGRYKRSCGNNKEINLFHTDDNEDDDEDFENGPRNSTVVKRETGLSNENNVDPIRERLDVTRQERPGSKNPYLSHSHEDHSTSAAWNNLPRSVVYGHFVGAGSDQTAIADLVNGVAVSKPPLMCATADSAAVQVEPPNLPTREEPQSVHHQVVNQLYEQTCGVSLHKIKRFLESRNPRPALPNIWKQICEYRTLNNILHLGSKDQLPHPRRFSNASPKPNSVLNPYTRIVQDSMDKALRQNAQDDMTKFKKFCPLLVLID